MALLFMDGMDQYDTDDWTRPAAAGWSRTGASSNVLPAASGGRFGGGSIRCESEEEARRPVNMTGSRLFVQAAFYLEQLSAASDERLIRLRNNAGLDLCLTVYVMATGALRLRDSNGAIVVTTGGGIVNEETWHYLILDATIGAAADVKVYIDDTSTPVIDETGVDTQDTETDVDMVCFCGASDTSVYGVYWDDVVIIDTEGSGITGAQGDCRIFTLKPDATTSTDDWTNKSETNSYEEVDDPIAPAAGNDDADGSYVYDPANSLDEVRWTYEDVGLTYDVKAVAMAITGRKTDSGNAQIRARAFGSATTYSGTIFDPTTDYQIFRDFMEAAADGGAWDAAEVNSTEFGVEIYALV